jgi:uncharacterized damage-inducible protein DinB
MSAVEAWLAGPVEGVSPFLQPVAHGLLNARQQVEEAVAGLSPEQLVARPGEIASIAYHVKHAIGSLDRLFTYARGEGLSDEQWTALRAERNVESQALDSNGLIGEFGVAVERAMSQLRKTPDDVLREPREVGRGKLPSTVLGLLFHGAEHSVRHAGQVVTTAKLVRSLPRS